MTAIIEIHRCSFLHRKTIGSRECVPSEPTPIIFGKEYKIGCQTIYRPFCVTCPANSLESVCCSGLIGQVTDRRSGRPSMNRGNTSCRGCRGAISTVRQGTRKPWYESGRQAGFCGKIWRSVFGNARPDVIWGGAVCIGSTGRCRRSRSDTGFGARQSVTAI